MLSYRQWALLMASGFRLLSWNCHLLPFLMQEVIFFLIQGIWQVWAPSLWEHRWQLKGCWNDFTPTLMMTNRVSGESGQTLQICLNISCVSDKCGRGLILPVMASAEVRGPTCLPALSWLIFGVKKLSRFWCWALCLFCHRASCEKCRAVLLVRELILHLQVEGPFRKIHRMTE